MAAGALLVGLPSVVGGRRIALSGFVLIAVSMAVSTFVGSATGNLGWVHTAVLVPWCLGGGLLLALGNPYLSVGTQAIAAMIVFGRFAEPPLAALQLAAYVLAGGLLAVAVLAVTRPPVTSRVQRQGLAAAASSLAALARTGAGQRNGVASAEVLDDAEILLDRGIVQEGGGVDDLRSLLDIARRARLELLVIDGLERQLARYRRSPDAGTDHGQRAGPEARRAESEMSVVEVALGNAAAALDAIGRAVAEGRRPDGVAQFDEQIEMARGPTAPDRARRYSSGHAYHRGGGGVGRPSPGAGGPDPGRIRARRPPRPRPPRPRIDQLGHLPTAARPAGPVG